MNRLIGFNISGYRLVDFLGAGGMGEVYRAVHSKIGRVVAIKVLTRFESGSDSTERFINEARIQAGLHHPNIATLYDFLECNGRPCIIMEYVDGQTLYERIRAHGTLPLSEAMFIFRPVVEAIAYLHDQGIVHRDIKSSNIKISTAGEVKLLDFGIAKDTSTPMLTLFGHCIGTPHYLSPEQVAGKQAGARSDIWSLGVLLYEMITGQLPFEAPSISGVHQKISRADYELPSALHPSIPWEMEDILSQCLRKNPARRYASARELLTDIERLSTILSAPRLSNFTKKDSAPTQIHWPMLSTAVVLALVLTTGFYSSDDGIELPGTPPVTALPPDEDGSAQDPKAPINIATYDGPAEVYVDGSHVGQTPYAAAYPVGNQVEMVLRRDGYEDETVQFEVREIGNEYSYSLKKR